MSEQYAEGEMGMFFHSADEAPERPADPELRRANMRRVGGLFGPYWRAALAACSR